MSSPRCDFLQSEQSHFMKYFLIERTFSDKARKQFKRVGKEDEVIVAPYPSFLHFDSPAGNIKRFMNNQQLEDISGKISGHFNLSGGYHKTNRKYLIFMAGSTKNRQLRRILQVGLMHKTMIPFLVNKQLKLFQFF